MRRRRRRRRRDDDISIIYSRGWDDIISAWQSARWVLHKHARVEGADISQGKAKKVRAQALGGEGKNEGGKDTGGSFLKDAGLRAGQFLAVLARFKRAGRWGPWRKDRTHSLALRACFFWREFFFYIFLALSLPDFCRPKKSIKSIIIKVGPGGWGAA